MDADESRKSLYPGLPLMFTGSVGDDYGLTFTVEEYSSPVGFYSLLLSPSLLVWDIVPKPYAAGSTLVASKLKSGHNVRGLWMKLTGATFSSISVLGIMSGNSSLLRIPHETRDHIMELVLLENTFFYPYSYGPSTTDRSQGNRIPPQTSILLANKQMNNEGNAIL